MKKYFIVAIIGLILTFLLGSFYWWNQSTKPLSSQDKPTRFVIRKGSTGAQVAENLYKSGLIKSPLAFKIYIRIAKKTNAIQAGEFTLSPSLTMIEIVDKFGKGPLQLWVTIPEGLRREEVVERFITSLEMKGSDATLFRSEFLDSSKGLEGQLFPDTYLFPRDVKGEVAVKRMTDLFNKKIAGLTPNSQSANLTENQLITLASIIERETKGVEEKPVVAGIMLNRLNIGMALQVDATVQYAVANENCLPSQMGKLAIENCKDWWPILTKDELMIDSIYNTYKYTGIPPGPIASPGLSSIEAAYSPQDSEYLFYIHSSDGKIHYAKTLIEHNDNIRKYL